MQGEDLTQAIGQSEYADADEPACKYCGGPAKLIPTEGPSHWQCMNYPEKHGKLQLSEVLGVEAGVIRG